MTHSLECSLQYASKIYTSAGTAPARYRVEIYGIKENKMIDMKKVLVPTDFSETSARAVNHAALIASTYGAKLTLLNVLALGEIMQRFLPAEPGEMPDDLIPAQQQVYKFVEEYTNRKIEETAKSDFVCKAPECNTVVLKGETPSVTIAQYAKSNDFDLIVMGTHGRTGISEWFFGSTTERLLRIAPCPVLAVGPDAKQHPTEEVFDRILFPFDLSDASHHALRYACAMAEKYSTKLDLLHVVEYRNLPESYTVKGSEIFREVTDLEQRILGEMEKKVNELYKGSHPLNAEFTVKEGKPFEEIVDFANNNNVKLIVIGNTGINETHGHRLGSTAENVMPRAKCPVLVVNTKIHEFLK
jgi:nucleotide-binding universal stress UspA family protein